MSINICICGGGGLGHVIAGVAAHKGFNVSILTRHGPLVRQNPIFEGNHKDRLEFQSFRRMNG